MFHFPSEFLLSINFAIPGIKTKIAIAQSENRNISFWATGQVSQIYCRLDRWAVCYRVYPIITNENAFILDSQNYTVNNNVN